MTSLEPLEHIAALANIACQRYIVPANPQFIVGPVASSRLAVRRLSN